MWQFSPVEPNTMGFRTKFDPSWSDVLGNAFEQSQENSMQSKLNIAVENYGRSEDAKAAGGELLQPDELNRRFGQAGLKFESPEYESVALGMQDRFKREQERAYYLDQVSSLSFGLPNPTSASSILAFGANVAGSLLHPLDAGIALFPFFGSGTKAAQVASKPLLKFAVGGVFDAAKLPLAETFPKLVPSLAQNATQQAIMEIPKAVVDIQESGKIDLRQIGNDMVAGAIQAEVFRHTIHLLGKLAYQTTDAAFFKAFSDIQEGKPVDVADNIKQDPNVIREEILAKERLNKAYDLREQVAREREYVENRAALLEEQLYSGLEPGADHLTAEQLRERAHTDAMEHVTQVEAEVRAAVDQMGVIANVDRYTLLALADEYANLKDGKSSPNQKAVADLLAEIEPRRKNHTELQSDYIRLAKLMNLGYDWKSWNSLDTEPVKSSRTIDPKTGATLRIMFDEPRVAQIGADIRARDQLLREQTQVELEKRIHESIQKYKAEQAELERKALFNAKAEVATLAQESWRLKEELDKLPERPRTEEEVKRSVPTEDLKTVEHVTADIKNQSAELQKSIGELTPEEEAYLEEAKTAEQEKFIEDFMAQVAGCVVTNG